MRQAPTNFIYQEEGKPRLRYNNQKYILNNAARQLSQNPKHYHWICSRAWLKTESCQCSINTEPTLSYVAVVSTQNQCTHSHDLNNEKWDRFVAIQEIVAIAAQANVEAQEAFDKWKLFNKERQKYFHGWDELKNKVYRSRKKLQLRPDVPKSREDFAKLIEDSNHKYAYWKFMQIRNAITNEVEDGHLFQILSSSKQEYEQRQNQFQQESIHNAGNNVANTRKRCLSQYAAYELRMAMIEHTQTITKLQKQIVAMKQELISRQIAPVIDEADDLFYQGGTDLFSVFFGKRLKNLLSELYYILLSIYNIKIN